MLCCSVHWSSIFRFVFFCMRLHIILLYNALLLIVNCSDIKTCTRFVAVTEAVWWSSSDYKSHTLFTLLVLFGWVCASVRITFNMYYLLVYRAVSLPIPYRTMCKHWKSKFFTRLYNISPSHPTGSDSRISLDSFRLTCIFALITKKLCGNVLRSKNQIVFLLFLSSIGFFSSCALVKKVQYFL